MTRNVKKHTSGHVVPTKTLIRLRRVFVGTMQSDQSLRCKHEEIFLSLAIQNAPSEDSNFANAQTDLNIRCAHMFEGTFSDVTDQVLSDYLRSGDFFLFTNISM